MWNYIYNEKSMPEVASAVGGSSTLRCYGAVSPSDFRLLFSRWARAFIPSLFLREQCGIL